MQVRLLQWKRTLPLQEFEENKGEFGLHEIVLRLSIDKKSLSYVNQKLRDLDADILSSEQYDDIIALDRKGRKLDNFKQLKMDLNKEMPDWHPNPIPLDGNFLEWWTAEVKLSKGERLPVRVTDQYGHLRNRAAVFFRHISYAHDIAKSKIATLANLFGALYYGRALTDKETVSTRTIDCHSKRLHEFDTYRISETFRETFVEAKDQLFGFLRLWYSTTDDTKHGKSDNHHVVIRTGDYGFRDQDDEFQDDDFFINPFFDCLSSFQSVTKDTMGNVDHNYQVFADACHPSEFVLSCYGGNTSDNAAKKEGIKTFEATMNSYQFEHSDWCQVYGIDRWAIFHNDPFHCCNLAIQHTSEKGLGKTDKGNNRRYIIGRRCRLCTT